jgi:hypothetical protein
LLLLFGVFAFGRAFFGIIFYDDGNFVVIRFVPKLYFIKLFVFGFLAMTGLFC